METTVGPRGLFKNIVCLLTVAIAACGVDPAQQTNHSNRVLPDFDVFLDGGEFELPHRTDSNFKFRWRPGWCLDFAPPPLVFSPNLAVSAAIAPEISGRGVYLNRCSDAASQSIRVKEVGDLREVELRDGEFCVTPANGTVAPLVTLTLQTCSTTGLASQRWRFDGDTFRSTVDPSLVIAPRPGLVTNGMPLVLVPRAYDDREFWTLQFLTGNHSSPHSGFVEVNAATNPTWRCCGIQTDPSCPEPMGPKGLKEALECGRQNSVVSVIDWIEMKDVGFVNIPPGVTLRGKRMADGSFPQIDYSQTPDEDATYRLFIIGGSDTRITNLHIHGCSPNTTTDDAVCVGVTIESNQVQTTIDHVDLSAWSGAAISVGNEDRNEDRCDNYQSLLTRTPKALVAYNFIHANRRDGLGYGVVVGSGGDALIRDNVFNGNRHAITSDGRPHTAYTASANIVLTSAPKQHPLPFGLGYTQDFDVHGSGEDGLAGGDFHLSGIAGLRARLSSNTFLATNRLNFKLRGDPCHNVLYNNNVSMVSRSDAVEDGWDSDDLKSEDLILSANRFSMPDPTYTGMGAGDFDGDGRDDLFIATGAGWYYSPSGRLPWVSLAAFRQTLSEVRLGDFDADGRTDVFFITGDGFFVASGGRSPAMRINKLSVPIADVLTGDFNGDGFSDVFYANGSRWRLSYSGSSGWTDFAVSSIRANRLRVGDFNGDGRADILGVESGNWSAVFAGTTTWTTLRPKLSDNLGVIGDFNADGISDVLEIVDQHSTRISYSASEDWVETEINSVVETISFRGVGRFDDVNGTDLAVMKLDTFISDFVIPGDNFIRVSSGGRAPIVQHSVYEVR